MILSTAYFPNVQYFSKIVSTEDVIIEVHENYQKQSYRNRCQIYSANGLINLTLPIIKGRSLGIKVKDIKIEYQMNWQKNHFKSIESAYRHSPFYEFLIDDLAIFFEKKEKYLLDFNMKILLVLLEQIGIDKAPTRSKSYLKPVNSESNWRSLIHPKLGYISDSKFTPEPYSQNFDEKNGFLPNLSIIDTLFQLGPETRQYLKSCSSKI